MNAVSNRNARLILWFCKDWLCRSGELGADDDIAVATEQGGADLSAPVAAQPTSSSFVPNSEARRIEMIDRFGAALLRVCRRGGRSPPVQKGI